MGICLVSVYDSAIAVCAKAFSTYIRVTVAALNFLGSDVFGTGIFTDISCHETRLASFPVHPFSFVFLHFLTLHVSRFMNWTVVLVVMVVVVSSSDMF